MPLKLRGAVRCGRCGKDRGIRHTCVTSGPRHRVRRHHVQNPVTWECATCHKRRGLRHTCHPKSDFQARRRRQATRRRQAERKRKRQAATARRAERRRRAAAERRAREKARRAAARRRPRPSRPRGDVHEPGTCADRDCPKYGCQAFFDGMDNCPRPHEGSGGGGGSGGSGGGE